MVDIKWSPEKNAKLKRERGVSFNEAADLILQGKHLPLVRKRWKIEQNVFLLSIRGYVHVVPFVFEQDGSIFLKTIFPDRKFDKLYGEQVP
jgi:uncharacterized DUF497 family protein